MPSNLTLTSQGAAFIARFEGFKAHAYICPAGKPTIGYGHVIRPDENWTTISEDTALELLQADATREAAPVARVLNVPLTTYQQDALISLAFNCGGGAIKKSALVRLLNAGLITDAADQFLVWNKAGGKTSKGLTRRRQAERALFLTGEYGEG